MKLIKYAKLHGSIGTLGTVILIVCLASVFIIIVVF